MLNLIENRRFVDAMQQDEELRFYRQKMLAAFVRYRYTYNFTWFGRPIIQTPEDMVILQEIVFSVRPDLIVETGVAHGGSLIFYASLLQMLGCGDVVGIDIDIRSHNRAAIETHPLASRIRLIQGSSLASDVVEEVRRLAAVKGTVLVLLDSNHTHDHVLQELELYSPLVRKGSYVVVFDTAIEDLADGTYPEREWGKGNNPKTAVHSFLSKNDRFVIDRDIENKILMTVAPDGYLRCIKD